MHRMLAIILALLGDASKAYKWKWSGKTNVVEIIIVVVMCASIVNSCVFLSNVVIVIILF